MATEAEALGEPIARGGVSDLHAWEHGQVLKLFRRGFGKELAQREATLTTRLRELGVRVPSVGEVVEVEGRFGVPMQRLDGVTLAEQLLSDPGTAASAGPRLADLQLALHRLTDASLPCGRERLRRIVTASARLSGSQKSDVIARLDVLPTEDVVCHGDFHAGNVFVTSDGLYVIDCATVHRGSPLADAAQTSVAMTEWLSFELPQGAHAAVATFIASYEGRYFAARPNGRAEFERWKPVVAAARLSLPHPKSSEEPLLRIIEDGLRRLR